jgi:hypothetical protein
MAIKKFSDGPTCSAGGAKTNSGSGSGPGMKTGAIRASGVIGNGAVLLELF